MDIRLTKEALTKVNVDLIFLTAFQKEGGIPGPATLSAGEDVHEIEKALGNAVSQTVREREFSAGEGETLLLNTFGKIKAKAVVVLGAGTVKDFSLETLRKMGGALSQVANGIKAGSVAGFLNSSDFKGYKSPDRLQAFAEGVAIKDYQFNQFRTKKNGTQNSFRTLLIQTKGPHKKLAVAAQDGLAVAAGVNLARDLTNRPPNSLNPKTLGNAAMQLAKKYKTITCKVFSPAEIKKQKMEALLAVAQGSATPPAFIHLKYTPSKKAKRSVGVVGKGITFDSGGLNIKTREMELMKFDMAGSAAVVGLFESLAKIKPDIAVEGFIPAAENMPSGSSYRPSDIIGSRSGKTIEVLNTDAEGRLALADALDFACERKPDYLIDIATLTGGAAYALGELITPVIGSDKKLVQMLLKAGERAGEPSWELPLFKPYKKGFIDGPADTKNSGTGSKASTINGALFLEDFVKNNTKWAHMDIASTAWADFPTPYQTKNSATGNPVRTLLYFLKSL